MTSLKSDLVLIKFRILEKVVFQMKFDTFSNGFYLNEYNKTGLKTYSDNPDFYNSFIEFAKANGSGSSYAFG